MIPFNLPVIGPSTAEHIEAFQNLTRAKAQASQAIGWAISLKDVLVNDGRNGIQGLLPTVKDRLPGVDP